MHPNEINKKRNYLRRVSEVLAIYKKHKEYDTPNTIIWRKYVFPIYHISYAQFNAYLGINIDRELKILASHENKKKPN